MSESAGERIQELFAEAVALQPAERAGYLDAACLGDQDLRKEVEILLACDDNFLDGTSDDGLLKSPLVRSPTLWNAQKDVQPVASSPRPPHGDIPTRLGRYQILGLIAEGGMGAVYEAEQDNPRRVVALKLIRPGLGTPTLLKRFRHEAQILGRLNHPGIAKVYEAGLAEDGQPFFAMEYIRGLPLDEYARRHNLDLRARMNMMARVCDAVHHAHDQGVIHRDLKPANILVDGAAHPKVLDFGVARITNADLLTAAGLTQTGQLLGTPNYMSPEQVTADPDAIDPRADVYALGVILYEIASDRLPFQLQNRPLAEAVRLILEQDPPLLGSIDAQLHGDVETIVARALEKAPSRRYSSAAELASDLRRWLAHEPIRARAPSTLYHLNKFVRRNKPLVAGVIATGVSLLLGIIGTTLFALAEAHQRKQAEHHAKIANEEQRAARFQAYRARISAAVGALQNHDVLDAERQLELAPEELRGWEWRHLQSRLDDSRLVLPLPVSGAGYLLPGPDGLRLAMMTPAGLYLSNLDGSEKKPLSVRVEGMRPDAVTWTRAGLRVVVWIARSTFQLLDQDGRVLQSFTLPEIDGPRLVILSVDGARLASYWTRDGKTRLAVLDARTGRRTAVCDGHPGGIRNLAFSPDGTRLASAGEDHTALVWDCASGALVATCRGHEDKLLGIGFSPDGTRVLTTSSDGTVRQWDAASGREVETAYERHSGEVITAAYSPDGQCIASAGTDRAIRVWRASGRRDVALLLGHTGGVIGLAFDPSGRGLASLSANSWRHYSGDDTVRVWNVRPQAALPALRGHTGPLRAVCYSPDGRSIASGGTDGSVRLWDAATGQPGAVLHHPGGVWGVDYGPGGRWLASACGSDNRLRLWDTSTATISKEIQVSSRGQMFVAVRPDGRRVAVNSAGSSSPSSTLHVCDVASGKVVYSAPEWAMAYSPDSRWLAVLDADQRTVVLLDAETHATIARFPGHTLPVHKAAFSPDSRSMASCSEDATVRVWQIETGASQVLKGHTDEILAVAFHPDGTRLASGGEDRTVRLWDLKRGEDVACLLGHASYIWALAFSPDGATLASGSGDLTVRLWDTVPLKNRYQSSRVVVGSAMAAPDSPGESPASASFSFGPPQPLSR